MNLNFEAERQPLAARMRPRTLAEFVGQEHILAKGRLLRRAIEADQLSSIILSGPPGTGKTTLARVIAGHTRSQFLSINAVLSGVKDVRSAIDDAQQFRAETNRRTILFVDEVHRWNKSQQDALLPWVEEGLLILIGATTENPFFEVNRALLSRSRVFVLKSLTDGDLNAVIDRTLADRDRGYGRRCVEINRDAREHLVATAAGDARTLLNALELAVETAETDANECVQIDLQTAEDSIQERAVLYDKDGDYHFDTISAFIKSVRGSDPDGALYWLARMVRAGENPRYIFRRLLILASEDVGLAEPGAISVVEACAAAFDRVGLPEGQFHLAHATLYLANAAKSNSTMAFFDALEAVNSAPVGDDVPNHLRDASRDGAQLGHGHGYQYPHAFRDHWVAQQYLPDSLRGRMFYQPGSLGWEGARAADLEDHRQLQLSVSLERREAPSSVNLAATRQWIDRVEGSTHRELAALRDRVLARITVHSEDRVALIGDGVHMLVWSVLRAVDGGLVAVWTSPEVAASVHHTVASRLWGPEAPQIGLLEEYGGVNPRPYSLDAAELHDTSELHGGPFERIVVRWYDQRATHETIAAYRALLAPGGRLVAVVTDPWGGTRPSAVLDLPEDERAELERAEATLWHDYLAAWESAAEGQAGDQVTATAERMVTREMVGAWFAPESALGAAITNPACQRAIHDALASWTDRTVTWRRVHRLFTVSPAAAPSTS